MADWRSLKRTIELASTGLADALIAPISAFFAVISFYEVAGFRVARAICTSDRTVSAIAAATKNMTMW